METYAKRYFFSQVVNLLNRLLKLEELLIKDKYTLVVNGQNIKQIVNLQLKYSMFHSECGQL